MYCYCLIQFVIYSKKIMLTFHMAPVFFSQCGLPCLKGVSKSDDNASNSFDDDKSVKLKRTKSASCLGINTNTVSIKSSEKVKNSEKISVYDNLNKNIDGNNNQLFDANDNKIRNKSLRNRKAHTKGFINQEMYDDRETVFTQNGNNVSDKYGNPGNSLIHSRVFSSNESPNSSVEMFEYNRTKDFNLNRNADCPNFLPDIVKELNCFQSSSIDEFDEQTQFYDGKQRKNYLLKSMKVLLNNLIDIEKEKGKHKELEKENGESRMTINENNLYLINNMK